MTDTRSMTGKTVLITGGTGGIGRAAAIALAGMGARVGITGRDRGRAEAAAAAIARESGADTAVYLASSAEAEGISGKYFADRKVEKSRDSSYDAAITGRLWQVSADLVALPVRRRA